MIPRPLRTAKQDLGTSEGIFSKFPTSTPVPFFYKGVSPWDCYPAARHEIPSLFACF